jgi:hypothetical protein
MDSAVVEVVARFAGTIIDVAHVSPTETYRIGTAPGCALAVPGLTCFPLVDAGKLRCPLGVPAVEHDGTTELTVGALSLQVRRTTLRRAPLARPRIEWSPAAFVLASLIAHLAVWLIALRFAPFEQLPRPRPVLRLVRVEHTGELAPVKPPPAPTQKPAVVQPASRARVTRAVPSERPAEPATSRSTGDAVGEAVARAMKSFDDTHVVERVSALRPEDTYNEDDANARGFGGGRRFDPTQRDGWGTVESGAYATMPFDFKQCPDKKQCSVEGPIPPLYVRTHVLARMAEIYACYEQHSAEPGTIVLEFTITADGAVRDARGSGLGETGACAARVVADIFFKALGSETHVRWPVRFNAGPG